MLASNTYTFIGNLKTTLNMPRRLQLRLHCGVVPLHFPLSLQVLLMSPPASLNPSRHEQLISSPWRWARDPSTQPFSMRPGQPQFITEERKRWFMFWRTNLSPIKTYEKDLAFLFQLFIHFISQFDPGGQQLAVPYRGTRLLICFYCQAFYHFSSILMHSNLMVNYTDYS